MFSNQLDYRAIQQRANAAIKRQQARTRLGLFAVNAFLYVISMAFVWGLYITRDYFYSSFVFAALIVMSAEWAVGVILHGASLWLSSETGTRRMHERFLVREIAREMARLGMDEPDMPIPLRDEKAKRQSRLTLEDGELVETHDWDANEPRQNGTPRE